MPLVCVHIPKTAGTSFRVGLDAAYPHRVVYDYGRKAESSPALRQAVTDRHFDPAQRAEHALEVARRTNALMVMGHFPAARYAVHVPAERLLTFVREPVARAASHYIHNVGRSNTVETFDAFLSNSGLNVQSRYLARVDLDSFCFVGITEHYDDSLRLFARVTGLSVPTAWINRKPVRRSWFGDRPITRLTRAQRSALRASNLEDSRLYEHLLAAFRARYRAAFGHYPR